MAGLNLDLLKNGEWAEDTVLNRPFKQIVEQLGLFKEGSLLTTGDIAKETDILKGESSNIPTVTQVTAMIVDKVSKIESVQKASTDKFGVVKIYNGIDSKSESLVASANSVRTVAELVKDTNNAITNIPHASSSEFGLTKISSNLEAAADDISASTTLLNNINQNLEKKITEINDVVNSEKKATTTQFGVVKLSDEASKSKELVNSAYYTDIVHEEAIKAATGTEAGRVKISDSPELNKNDTALSTIGSNKLNSAINDLSNSRASITSFGLTKLINEFTAQGEDVALSQKGAYNLKKLIDSLSDSLNVVLKSQKWKTISVSSLPTSNKTSAPIKILLESISASDPESERTPIKILINDELHSMNCDGVEVTIPVGSKFSYTGTPKRARIYEAE